MNDKKGKIDWLLLIFLILLTNQAVFSVKLLGIAFIYLFRFDLRFQFRNKRLPLFYPAIIGLSLFVFLFITREFSAAYITAFLVGNAFWVFCLLASHQFKLSVERYGPAGVYRTVRAFTIIHFITCLVQLARIIIITGVSNPYDSKLPFPYGMSTGDNVYGIFMENSYYSIMVSSMLAVYFLFRKDLVFATLAIICFVLVFGNLGTLIFSGLLFALFVAGIFFSGSKRFALMAQYALPDKYFLSIPFLYAFIVLLYISISPSNYQYIIDKVNDKVFSVQKDDRNSYATMIGDQKMDEQAYVLYNNAKQEEDDNKTEFEGSYKTNFTSVNDEKLALTTAYIRNLQGKNLSLLETKAYLMSGVRPLLFGAGTARFSSTAANKVSGLDSSRLFMSILHYRSPQYEQNHYQLVVVRETIGDDALKSTANWPDSFYNQILGEYGILGMSLFLIFYVGYFLKKYRRISYTPWLLALLVPFAHLNYTFETLCVIPFFELLAFADMDEHQTQATDYA